ncbi:GIY-YIG nuclease family protein [Lederbergia citrea]|uniref:GIY-YIG nuclease family protein n=1 Tax=Lederbergia citrea TaxID=2833581 RepID=A0A942UW80_9BACI|nr:GIY-YIG nuclease family protein [Lederbergia citrea]MBS4179752.1 GIY-YIG nuclease family protein [Lederbergia citrea]MBS4206399.1 GIY-YIG nuclease family protein [Lederbergia citrea]MBS4225019.1 GIY-YIG nuclease family protein [Lederbergia citrea]
MAMKNDHYFYVLECNDGSYYGGYTIDLERRLAQHNSGKGAKYTRMRKPVKIIYASKYDNKSEALRAEYSFKRLTRLKKEQFLNEAGEWDADSEKF